MKYILRRHGKYLNEKYLWGNLPRLIPECYFQQVLEEAMQYKDRPLEVGETTDGDLDRVEWKRLW